MPILYTQRLDAGMMVCMLNTPVPAEHLHAGSMPGRGGPDAARLTFQDLYDLIKVPRVSPHARSLQSSHDSGTPFRGTPVLRCAAHACRLRLQSAADQEWSQGAVDAGLGLQHLFIGVPSIHCCPQNTQ